MLYITKAPPARSPSLRAAAPKQRAAPKAAPPVAKPAAQADKARRRALLDAAGADGFTTRSTMAKPAAAVKRPSTTAKPAVAKTQAARALKSPVPFPAPRQAPPKVQIKFPRLPTQVRAARYEAPNELQVQLTRYRRFLATAKMVSEARKLTSDEKHQIELARARIAEIRALGLVGVR